MRGLPLRDVRIERVHWYRDPAMVAQTSLRLRIDEETCLADSRSRETLSSGLMPANGRLRRCAALEVRVGDFVLASDASEPDFHETRQGSERLEYAPAIVVGLEALPVSRQVAYPIVHVYLPLRVRISQRGGWRATGAY